MKDQLDFTYVEAIGYGWPGIQVSCNGDGRVYEDIILEAGGPLPTKQELDTWIDTTIRNNVWRMIQEERTRRQHGGVFIPSVNKWFHSDLASRTQHLGLVLMGTNMPTNINWKTMDGSFVTMSPTLAAQIFNAVAMLDMTAFAVAEQHRANMLASPTPATYDFSGGWPAIYGG